MSDISGSLSCIAILIAAMIGFYPLLRKRKPVHQDFLSLHGQVHDYDTPRIMWNADGGVMVKFGNTPHYELYSEAEAKRLPGVKDERKTR